MKYFVVFIQEDYDQGYHECIELPQHKRHSYIHMAEDYLNEHYGEVISLVDEPRFKKRKLLTILKSDLRYVKARIKEEEKIIAEGEDKTNKDWEKEKQRRIRKKEEWFDKHNMRETSLSGVPMPIDPKGEYQEACRNVRRNKKWQKTIIRLLGGNK